MRDPDKAEDAARHNQVCLHLRLHYSTRVLRLTQVVRLTMRLSDAGLRQPQTKLIYSNHRHPPSLTEDVPRDRSNRLLEARTRLSQRQNIDIQRHG
jgi:hypothetical protein